MDSFSRRIFLIRSSIAAAAAGVASTVPGFLGVAAESAGPATDGAAADADAVVVGSGATAGPLVAHVRDAATGEVGIFNGTSEVVIRDPQLVSRMLRAGR